MKMVKTERERSSGGIVVKDTCGNTEILLIKDLYGRWTWPKGKIDRGETSLEAARREIGEETGLKEIQHISKIGRTDYFYKRDGKLIDKTVYLYLFKLTGNKKLVIQKSEVRDGKWVSPQKAGSMLSYRGAKGMMRRALHILKSTKREGCDSRIERQGAE